MVPAMKHVFPKVAAAAIAGLSAGVITALNFPAVAQSLPEGKGKELVGRICVSCHDLAPITTSGGFTRRDWEQVVQSMIDMGADITPDEVPQIVNYLAASFPPKGSSRRCSTPWTAGSTTPSHIAIMRC